MENITEDGIGYTGKCLTEALQDLLPNQLVFGGLVTIDTYVMLLANSISIKSNLNLSIVSLMQCTSDFLLALYLSIMGELPSGILTDGNSTESQEHNVSLIVSSLANEYLHIDLSHISASCFVAGDPVTIYNLLEILDGLLEFMLEQIELQSDSGEEGDVDSDISSIQNQISANEPSVENKDNETYAIDTFNHTNKPSPRESLSSVMIPNADGDRKKADPKSLNYKSLEEAKRFSSSQPALESSTLTSAVETMSNTYVKDIKPKLNHQSASKDIMVPEKLVSDMIDTHHDHNVKSTDQEATRPMFIESLKHVSEINGERILEDLTNSLRLRQSLKSPNKLTEKSEDEVLSSKGIAISISDFTSESSKSDYELHENALTKPKELEQREETSDGIDVPDGIPRPTFHSRSPVSPEGGSISREISDPHGSDGDKQHKDWEGLLDNLQRTVEESKRVREKYFATPQPPARAKSNTTLEDETTKEEESLTSSVTCEAYEPPVRQRNVRFQDTVSEATAQRMNDFKKVLQKEKDLQHLKNKILASNFRDHLEEVEAVERRKMKPLVQHTSHTEKDFQRSFARKRRKKERGKTNIKKVLAASAKWKSWQSPVVVRTPHPRSGKVKTRIEDKLVIGEHDLLPHLLSEFPGLELSSTTINNAWRKQFRQMEVLTKSEHNHALKKRMSEKRLEEAHNRHHQLIEIMRKEHDHNQRVRDAKERAAGEQEAVRRMKDRRQQSARVRRYYRDYQLQMRARMLKRRTREEKLFKNLFEEGLKIQRSRLNDIRRYARDKRSEQQIRQQNEISSMENYYRDQFEMLAETLASEKKDLRTRNDAQSKLLRQMTRGLRKKMEKEINSLQEQITRDDDDIYYRELEADRIRRQLQLATYNAKFHASIANKFEQ